MAEPQLTRRAFLRGLAGAAAAGALGAVLSGCDAVSGLVQAVSGPEPASTPIPTPAPTPAPTPEPTPTPDPLPPDHTVWAGTFELPIAGATVFAIYHQPLYVNAGDYSQIVVQLFSGTAMRVLEINDDESWLHVTSEGVEGWMPVSGAAVNLPDVVPSILYDDTDAYASAFKAQGRDIPGITGLRLYNATAFNPRFGQDQFIMPVLYHAAKKFYAAQQAALGAGYCLRVYELFRPMDTQLYICSQVEAMAAADPEVKAGISTPPWSTDWFIATGRSNHQMGYAGDVSLVRIREQKVEVCGGYGYPRITDYEWVEMPTAIHEMSSAAASLLYPVNSSTEEWRTTPEADTMTDGSRLLKKFCTEAGLSPLASEWWHFNDNGAITQELLNKAMGDFIPSVCVSVAPDAVQI